MSETLERLSVEIFADLSELTSGFAKVDTAVDKLEGSVKSGSGKINNHFEGMKSVVGGFIGGLVAGFATEAVGAIGSFMQKTLEAADDLGDLAARLGVNTDAVQRLQSAFVGAGGSPELMSGALDKLNKSLGDFRENGKGAAADAFKRLGLEADINSGKLKTSEDVFYAVADAMQGIEDPALKASLAGDIFSKSYGPDMLEVLGYSGQAMKSMGQEAEKLGLVMDEGVLKKTADAKLEIDKFKFAASQMASVFSAEVIVGITNIIEKMKPFIEKFQEAFKAISDALMPSIKALMGALGELGNSQGSKIVMKVMGDIAVIIGKTLVGAIKLSIDAITATIKAFNALMNLGSEFKKFVDNLITKFAQFGKMIIEGLVQGFENAKQAVINKVTHIGDEIMTAFKKKVGIASPAKRFIEFGMHIVDGLVKGIDDNLQKIKPIISKMGDEMKPTLEAANDNTRTWADEFKSIFDELGIHLDKKTSAILSIVSKLAKLAFPKVFGSGTSGGGILDTIGTIFGAFGGFRANGGAVSAGSAYVVGEKRPELFIPGQSGTIIPSIGGAANNNTAAPINIYLGNELIYSEMHQIAGSAAAQAVNISRSQVPVDMARAQRNRVW